MQQEIATPVDLKVLMNHIFLSIKNVKITISRYCTISK